jgi:hypothetical protein
MLDYLFNTTLEGMHQGVLDTKAGCIVQKYRKFIPLIMYSVKALLFISEENHNKKFQF